MLTFWIIGSIVIMIAAFIIIKLMVPKDSNSDSNLGILEHPSTFEKQSIEYVDETLRSTKSNSNTNGDE